MKKEQLERCLLDLIVELVRCTVTKLGYEKPGSEDLEYENRSEKYKLSEVYNLEGWYNDKMLAKAEISSKFRGHMNRLQEVSRGHLSWIQKRES